LLQVSRGGSTTLLPLEDTPRHDPDRSPRRHLAASVIVPPTSVGPPVSLGRVPP